MTQIGRTGHYLSALDTADGSEVKPDDSGYVSLTNGHTYVFILSTTDATTTSVKLQTDAAIAFNSSGAFIEVTNDRRNPRTGQTARNDEVSDWSTTTGDWVKYDPSTAYVPTVGTGWTITNMTATKTAAIGACVFDIGNSGAFRTRMQLVCTTAGKARVSMGAKD